MFLKNSSPDLKSDLPDKSKNDETDISQMNFECQCRYKPNADEQIDELVRANEQQISDILEATIGSTTQ